MKSPTLEKLTQIATVLRIHPVTLLALSNLPSPSVSNVRRLMSVLERELDALTGATEID